MTETAKVILLTWVFIFGAALVIAGLLYGLYWWVRITVAKAEAAAAAKKGGDQ